MRFLAFFLLLLQNPPAVPTSQGTAPPEPPKAVVRGRVYALDTGAPLKRAQLTLRLDRRQSDPQSTGTDAQGAYEFRNLEPGTYNLYCTKTGFVPMSYGQRSSAAGQPPVPLTVREGQELKDVDFRLIRGGVISGTVIDEDGEPLSNVQVQALLRSWSRGQSRTMPRGFASTDDRGNYRIFNLPPGRYYVQAIQRSFGEQESSYAPVFYPNSLLLQDAQRIDVSNGAEVPRVDFTLRPVPTFSVSGRVLDQMGKPLSEGFVSAMAADSFTTRFGGNQIRPDGSFRMRGLIPGRYRLMIMISDRGGSGMSGRPVSKPFDLGAANLENLVVTVGPGVSVHGRLVAEGGTVTSDNLRIMLSPKGEGMVGPFMGGGMTMVNKDLTFEIPNVQAGDYEVNLMAPNSPFYVRELRAGGKDVLERGLTVAEGAAVPDLEVVLAFDSGTVSGRVLNDAGEPLAGAAVALLSADAQKRASERYFRSGAADQNGNYTVRGVIPGDYLLVVWPEADVSRVQDPDLFTQLEKYAVRISVARSGAANQDARLTPELKTIAQAVGQ